MQIKKGWINYLTNKEHNDHTIDGIREIIRLIELVKEGTDSDSCLLFFCFMKKKSLVQKYKEFNLDSISISMDVWKDKSM